MIDLSYRSTRILIHLVYLVLGLIWLATVLSADWPLLTMLLPFTLLMLLKGYLHGQIERVREDGWAIPYLLLQCALAGALVRLAGGGPIVEALFGPIVGEAIGLFPHWRGRLAAFAGIVIAWGSILLWLGDPIGLWPRLPWTVAAFGFATAYVLLYLKQAQERERAESLVVQLQEAHRHLQTYAGQLAELTLSQERQRMARELHDTLAQGLAGLVMQLEATDELLERGEPDRAQVLVQRSLARSRRALAEARAAIQALRLPLERPEELFDALNRELERARSDGGLTGRLELDPGPLAMDGAIAAQLYYIAREGITNTLRHAQATQVVLRLWDEGERVGLSLTDDGVGFDPQAVIGQPGRFGLTGLHERARLVGGEVELRSSPGQGCQLTVRLPKWLPGGEGADDTGSDRR